MVTRNFFRRFLSTAIATSSLMGCAATDQFASRAVHYNLEYEQTQDQGIVLNVLRAYKRRPLEFNQISLTASGTPSGSLAASIPYAQYGGMTAGTLTPTLSLSNGPTLTVTPLDTQEFYNGILKAVPMSTIDLFVQRGIPEDLLLNLLFSRVVVSQRGGSASTAPINTYVAQNQVSSDGAVDGYQRLVELLIEMKLTTASMDATPDSYGSPFTAADLSSSDTIAKAASASLQLTKMNWCDLDAGEQADLALRDDLHIGPVASALQAKCDAVKKANPFDAGEPDASKKLLTDVANSLSSAHAPTVFYSFMKKPDADKKFSFCFTPGAAVSQDDIKDGRNAFCGAPKASAPSYSIILRSSKNRELSGDLCKALNDLETNAPKLDCSRPYWAGQGFTLQFVPRSTYGVIYYLGEVVRRAIAPEFDATPRQIAVHAGPSRALTPLFVLDDHEDYRSFVRVRYDNQSYEIPNTSEAGETNEVLDIVNELLALNKSAKELPSSTVITAIGVP